MARRIAVESAQLQAGARTLRGALAHSRVSGVDPRDLGGSTASGAFDRFDAYWRAGQTAVTQSLLTLAEGLETTATAYQQREAEDREHFFGF